MNTKLNQKEEVRDITNTHPAILKREDFAKIDVEINMHREKVKFSIISAIFFLFISGMIVFNYEIVSPYFAIIPILVLVIFVFRAILCHEDFEDAKINRRVVELFFEENDI